MDRLQLQSHVDTLLHSEGVDNERLLLVFHIQATLLLAEQQERIANSLVEIERHLTGFKMAGLPVEIVSGGH